MFAPAGLKSQPPTPPALPEEERAAILEHALTKAVHLANPHRNPGRAQSRPELERFRAALLRAMTDRNLTASQLAREIWGTTVDTRGYKVARNRDRIAHYLAGTGYPAPAVLEKMARVLGVDPAMLAKDESVLANHTPVEERVAQRLGASINVLTPVGGPPLAQITLHHAIPLPAATEIIRLYNEALAELDRTTAPPAGDTKP